jgi:hypothetical protein
MRPVHFPPREQGCPRQLALHSSVEQWSQHCYLIWHDRTCDFFGRQCEQGLYKEHEVRGLDLLADGDASEFVFLVHHVISAQIPERARVRLNLDALLGQSRGELDGHRHSTWSKKSPVTVGVV